MEAFDYLPRPRLVFGRGALDRIGERDAEEVEHITAQSLRRGDA